MGAYIRNDKHEIEQDFDRVFDYFPILKERVNQWAGTLSEVSSRCWPSVVPS